MTSTTRLTGNRSGRNGTVPDIIVLHDEEGDSLADNLAAYLQRPEVQASYHLIRDRFGNRARGVNDSDAAWAAGPIANRAGLHLCATGYAHFSRAQWLEREAQLDGLAEDVAEWSVKYGIPLVKLSPDDLNRRGGATGVCGHGDVAAAWRETSHTDPGNGFPFDVLINKATAIIAGVTTTSTEDTMAWDTPIPNRYDGTPKASEIIAWTDFHASELYRQLLIDVRATAVDFVSIGWPDRKPEDRVKFDALTAIYNADARAFEAREMARQARDEAAAGRRELAAVRVALESVLKLLQARP